MDQAWEIRQPSQAASPPTSLPPRTLLRWSPGLQCSVFVSSLLPWQQIVPAMSPYL